MVLSLPEPNRLSLNAFFEKYKILDKQQANHKGKIGFGIGDDHKAATGGLPLASRWASWQGLGLALIALGACHLGALEQGGVGCQGTLRRHPIRGEALACHV